MARGIDINTIKGAVPESAKQSVAQKIGDFILKNALILANQMLPKIEKTLLQFDGEGCPSSQEMDKIYKTRENIVEDANKISSKLDNFVKALTGIS